MIEIIFNGRGGQGAVTAAEILATAAFQEGKYSHALPYFRAERKGAPVIAYVRISEKPIEVRGSVEKADIFLILDAALLKFGNILSNSKPNSQVFINTALTPEEILNLSNNKDIRIETIDATAISEKIYGQSSIPRVNLIMLGQFAARTKAVKMESILTAIDEYFIGDNDIKAKEGVRLAYNTTEKLKVN